MGDIRSIVARHPQRELEIRRLFARDERFRAICRDFEEAATALCHWESVAADTRSKVGDYASFLGELEAEILGQLDLVRATPKRGDEHR